MGPALQYLELVLQYPLALSYNIWGLSALLHLGPVLQYSSPVQQHLEPALQQLALLVLQPLGPVLQHLWPVLNQFDRIVAAGQPAIR